MAMVAEQSWHCRVLPIPSACLDERGQSVLEFMFLAPVIVGIAMIMMRVNSAIQISIVNQQYARAQATWLAFNYGIYPELKLRVLNFDPKNYNEMVLGVSFNSPNGTAGDSDDTGSGSAKYKPQPMIQDIRRSPSATQGSNDPSISQGALRSQVRIRSTVAMCTQFITNTTDPTRAVIPISPSGAQPASGPYNLSDDPGQFSGVLCGSPLLK